jgi:protein TonB
MKLSSFKLCFAFAAVAHVICIGVLFIAGAVLRPHEIRLETPPVMLTLVDGSDEPAAPLKFPPELEPAPPVQSLQTPPLTEADNRLLIKTAPQPAPPEHASLSVPMPSLTPPPALTAPVSAPAPVPAPVPARPRVSNAPAPEPAPWSAPSKILAIAAALPNTTARPDNSSINPGENSAIGKRLPAFPIKPGYLKTPEPPYPMLARRRHQQGLVILSLTVSASGSPASVRLKETSGFPILDEPALKAVKDWEFNPARIGAIRVESEIEVPVRFTLSN